MGTNTAMAISGTDLLEVPTIFLAYVRDQFQGLSPNRWQQDATATM